MKMASYFKKELMSKSGGFGVKGIQKRSPGFLDILN